MTSKLPTTLLFTTLLVAACAHDPIRHDRAQTTTLTSGTPGRQSGHSREGIVRA